jgi:hypothetical protein
MEKKEPDILDRCFEPSYLEIGCNSFLISDTRESKKLDNGYVWLYKIEIHSKNKNDLEILKNNVFNKDRAKLIIFKGEEEIATIHCDFELKENQNLPYLEFKYPRCVSEEDIKKYTFNRENPIKAKLELYIENNEVINLLKEASFECYTCLEEI